MTLCPLCQEGLRTIYAMEVGVQSFGCGTLVFVEDGVLQSNPCRIRQLERVLREILPLAQQGSCEHDGEPPSENVCCQWRTVASAIEALGIQPKQPQENTL